MIAPWGGMGWSKFLLIAPWGGMGAVTRVPGLLRQVPETRDMLEEAMREIARVATAHGVELEADIVARTLTFIDRLPPEGTASMQRDLVAGRPSELEAQNGAVVRFGNARRVDTPVNAFIYRTFIVPCGRSSSRPVARSSEQHLAAGPAG